MIWLNADRHRLYCAIGKHGIIEVIDTQKTIVDEKVTRKKEHTPSHSIKEGKKLYAFLPKSCRAAVYKEIVHNAH